MKEELICIKSIYDFKEGQKYKFRADNPDAIYIYYPKEIAIKINRVGMKFSTVTWIWDLSFYKSYFCTIKEQRKTKLEKLAKLWKTKKWKMMEKVHILLKKAQIDEKWKK